MARLVRVRSYVRKSGPVRAHVRSAPGKSSAGNAVAAGVAITLLLGIVSGGTGVEAGSALGGLGAQISRSNPRGSHKDTLGATVRLQRKGFRAFVRATSGDDNCFSHSYGEVRRFFLTNPCRSLYRALIEVCDKRQNVVLVAIVWVEMPDSNVAGQLKALLDRAGTGNVTELSRERGRYRHVRFTGDIYASRMDGTTVVNAQAQPVGPSPGAAVLREIVTSVLH